MKKVLIGLYLIVITGVFILLLSNDLKEKKDNVTSAGEQIYSQQCNSCHGKTGKGERLKAGTALNNQHFLNTVTDKDLSNYIKHGRTGTQMPAYESIIPKEDMNNLIAYIRNWQTDKLKLSSPNEISGNIKNGEKLYRTYCLTCHGEKAVGMQKMGPALSNPEYLKYTSDRQIWITTAYGREGTTMGPSLKGQDGVKQLKEENITDIVSYIRSLQK